MHTSPGAFRCAARSCCLASLARSRDREASRPHLAGLCRLSHEEDVAHSLHLRLVALRLCSLRPCGRHAYHPCGLQRCGQQLGRRLAARLWWLGRDGLRASAASARPIRGGQIRGEQQGPREAHRRCGRGRGATPSFLQGLGAGRGRAGGRARRAGGGVAEAVGGVFRRALRGRPRRGGRAGGRGRGARQRCGEARRGGPVSAAVMRRRGVLVAGACACACACACVHCARWSCVRGGARARASCPRSLARSPLSYLDRARRRRRQHRRRRRRRRRRRHR